MNQSRRVVWICMAAIIPLMAAMPLGAMDFDFDWRFSKGDFATAMMPAFDDSAWRMLDVPHDWSVGGPFSADYASGSGYAPGGIGWYRKHFKLDAANRGKLVVIEFDGVYHNSEVWINGHFVGRRPCGYSSFQYNLTRHVKFADDENVIAVRVDHTKFADSRWYTGSGIYRHVRLHISDRLHIGQWGVYVTTPEVSEEAATIRVETVVCNDHDRAVSLSLDSSVVAPDGKAVASLRQSASMDADAEQTFVSHIKIADPELWSLESPSMYMLRSALKAGEEVVQEVSTPFGIRTIAFDPDRGFFLNGKAVKLKGVCLHHDAGCLGAAVPDKVLERRLRLMKDLGANAIRTSHNPPAPELLDMCDRLGLLVKDEAFDEFTPPKNKWVAGWNAGQPSKFGYGEVFAEWSVRDMGDLVRRDRNHPCIIMWSIGNEIDYPNDPFSHPVLGNNYRCEHPPAENLVKHAQPLIEAVRKWDRTRPVTAALASIDMSNAVGLPQLLDVVGYNYQEQHYEADHKTYPSRFIFGSENGDSYNAWVAVRDNDYVAGQFLWTGIDYLGEAGRWPNRANGAGLLDLCGFKKPIAWFRQSLWSDEPMVYLCVSGRPGRRGPGMGGAEHWNWPDGARVSVNCFTNCDEVSLALNGEALGMQRLSEARNGVLTWEVPFRPGVLKAAGRDAGREVCEFSLKTAGPATRIVLSPDATRLSADGKDVCHVEFQITDGQGVRVPDAAHEVTFDVDGPGRIIGIENGDLSSVDDPQDNTHKALQGRGLAIFQATREPGKVRLTARSHGLVAATTEIEIAANAR
ncbi:MAG: glycoside hydrolase family 2 TIM barrel-domain containing protein [Sedimentisphaerales bacterium]|nr:glycoside hydrolase family 2 TIM barrel-domain containing protein [Sedimentisphaerales bacterium]HNY78392.1 glycoside hydrolase family 2 TIM barrel-domain containing protein [Sedimentisphaerales bacterium]HOC63520.1 glycoside hydrolase family 2 TIM barrel-domain containing protein [Sedimentisphaerales bacterium]HOH62859.1 glycoside hydrolase family 2 TIM barrel-domain containing protein [Sedimentisphaerales bacterium]HQA91339.1 glycoside hydrolase family 2 TIM barrel-domain containing protei